LLSISCAEQNEKKEVSMNMIDLKEKEVFKKEDRGHVNLVDEKYLQVNQVCLEPGQQVPQHNANSNVTLMVVHGDGTFHVGNEVTRMGPGKLLRVPFQSPMSIKNESKERLAFLVIKAPHPNEMK
jgi:quercetin dioxygenase-like cupin family protein